MIETKIYVGLNDSDTHTQKFTTDKYVSLLKTVCKNYHVPFSFMMEEGGYMHEDGKYTQELSIVISMIDVKKNVVNEIARDLCVMFHQESVLITEGFVRAYFVSEKLEEET